MSSEQNPLENLPPVETTYPPMVSPPEFKPKPEDPPWSGWDVLVIVATTIGASFFVGMAVLFAAKLLVYKSTPVMDLTRIPELAVLAELLTYFVVFAIMYRVVEVRTGEFWRAIRWNWPGASWAGFLLAGALLYFVLAGIGQLLPIPKHLPIDRFFQNARQATIMSIFAVTVAPLMEELFFRGFLYPVLARRLGVVSGVALTSAAFAILHGAQLKYSWAVLIIFLVGVALTTVRAITRSVAASFLLHVGYNGTLSLLMFVVTGGFHHLDRLNQ
ncbi:MAG TPA: type II CAAX endopeptidase family protein [Terriglobales bacterium]|nr:type II CAAX endopeptidase family protein [Terriglobales bacterium]